jgi:hypothetical protein
VNRHTTGGLACGLALLLATACSNSDTLSTNGPFGNGGPDSGTVCDWTRPGGVAYSGFEEFPNTGGTATIERVALVDPRNLRLVAAWVVPTPGGAGVGPGYPPASSLGTGATRVPLELRQHIPAAVVRHTRGKEAIDLVIVVKPSGRVGTSKAINLYYETGGTRYLLHFPYGLKVWVGRTC